MTKQELQKDIAEMQDTIASGALTPEMEAGLKENLSVAQDKLKTLETESKKAPKEPKEPKKPAPKLKKPEILTQKAIDELTPEECRAILKERADLRAVQSRRVAKARKGAAKARKNPEETAKERVSEALQAMSTNIARSDEYKKKSEKLIKKAEEQIEKILDKLRETLEKLSKKLETDTKYAKGGPITNKFDSIKKDEKYFVIIREDYEGNPGDPVRTEDRMFETLSEAQKYFDVESSHSTNENGIERVIELTKGPEDDPFLTSLQRVIVASDELPKDAIITYYRHHRYMGYAYEIISVEVAREGMRYVDLPYSDDRLSATWAHVSDDLDEFIYDVESAHCRPFNKINSGWGEIDSFLNENGFELIEGRVEEIEKEEEPEE